jgi:hypothetical protein
MKKLPFEAITDSSSSGSSLVRPKRRKVQHLLLHLLILLQLVSEQYSSCLMLTKLVDDLSFHAVLCLWSLLIY